MALTAGSLFSGIGGIDLGLERAGMVTRWFVEWDAHCQNVLRRHWPGLPIYGDITAVDWSGVEPVDVLAGGFPCQPVSTAGQRRAQDDSRWLWPYFAAAVRGLRPRYVLVENVRNLLAVNGGSAFGEVVGDLAACGYDAEWDCIPASALGANHQRDRLWLVAYPTSGGRSHGTGLTGSSPLVRAVAGPDGGDQHGNPPARGAIFRPPSPSSEAHVAYTEGERIELRQATRQRLGRSPGSGSAVGDSARSGRDDASPSEPGEHQGWEPERPARGSGRIDGGPGWWATEPDVGRVAHGVPHRVDRLRALGNAVVPQVVEWIGARIVAFDEGREVRPA